MERRMGESFEERIGRVRAAVEGLAKIPEMDESGWFISVDEVFWDQLGWIEATGRARDASRAEWLADFTQIDDLGPMGRALFLSEAALIALEEMPEAALDAGRRISSYLPDIASCYWKVGLIKVLLASGSSKA